MQHSKIAFVAFMAAILVVMAAIPFSLVGILPAHAGDHRWL